MRRQMIVAMPGNGAMADALAAGTGADLGELELRSFPDGETYLRILSDVAGRDIALVCTLDRPNDKIMPLLFAAATARELGAAKVELVAPYLAYMRQDRRFKPGEAVTSREAARLFSEAFDGLVTVDPHLHRYGSLAEIYSIPARVAQAAPLISQWIRANVTQPLIIGPDSESKQWVAAVAQDAGVPYTVLEKLRRGDRDVQITVRNLDQMAGRTPVLVDDIISSGRTMIETVRGVAAHGGAAPVCIAVHGVFADHADQLLAAAGARVVTCNTIPHPSNAINVAPLLVRALKSDG
jgi:ribose-phosphate pyrophosphokinase